MKKEIIGFISLFCSSFIFAQDTLPNFQDSFLVKGFYKSYQEFLSNSPSVILDFSTVLIRASKEDSTIICADYILPDSLDNFDKWGFCDGKNIFVRNGTFFVTKYWKAQCKGPNPYFYYFHKDIPFIPSVAGVVFSAIATTLPPSCTLMFIDKNGRPQNASRFNLKQLFRNNPVLFKEFKKEDEDLLYDNILIKYLILYNDSKIKR